MSIEGRTRMVNCSRSLLSIPSISWLLNVSFWPFAMMLAVWRRSSERVPPNIELAFPAATPTVLCTRVTKFRPFKGMSCTDRALTRVDSVALSVCKAGLCASTSTVCVTSPTCSCTFARARSPAETARITVDFLKLVASTVSVYCPGCIRLKIKSPVAFDVVVLTSLVAALWTVTFTPGITAPPASDIVPRISAVLTWAEALLTAKNHSAIRHTESATVKRLLIYPLHSKAIVESHTVSNQTPLFICPSERQKQAGSISEQIFDAELHLPRRCISRTRNTAKGRRTEISVRRLKTWRIRDVIALDAKLHRLPFSHVQRLGERNVQNPLRRGVHRPRAEVTCRVLGLERKCGRVEPALDGMDVRTRIGIANQIGAIGGSPSVGTIGGGTDIGLGGCINDREIQAR